MKTEPPDTPADLQRSRAGEEELVSELQAGNPDAVSEFLERTHHAVYCMACRLSRDPDRRRDWTHEVLLSILDDLKKGRFVYLHPGSFWAWFRKRAYYRLLTEYRRQWRRWSREEGGTVDGEPFPLESLPGGEDPTLELERAEVLAAIESCLEKLPSRHQRAALTLLLIQGSEYERIAEALAAPLNTVRSWIRRGRLAMRKCLMESLHLSMDGRKP